MKFHKKKRSNQILKNFGLSQPLAKEFSKKTSDLNPK